MTVYDLAYQSLLALALPVLLVRPALRRKLSRARRERNGDVHPRKGERPCVLIHAVSVGEVSATREMVRQLLATPGPEAGAVGRAGDEPSHESGRGLHIVISVTTDTGFERAQQLYGADASAGRVSVVRYPLDYSGYVRRFLDRLRPDVVVLMELEVWPNFVGECKRRRIPVLLVNGRITERSYRSYRRANRLVRPMYAGLREVCAQEQVYAQRFIDLGVPADRVKVTGTMKFDSAQVGDRVEGDAELARELGLRPRALGGDEPVLVCGSTGPGEEELLLKLYERLLERHRALRIVIVPRKPERFDEVARCIVERFECPVVRRSHTGSAARSPVVKQRAVILGDTMGELRRFYSLADVVVVGRTLVDLGEKQRGSDMIEPAALGKPVVVGPYTQNFAEPMRALMLAEAIRQVTDAEEAFTAIDMWLSDPAGAAGTGRRARQVIEAARGATQRHVERVLAHLQSGR